MNMMGEMNVHQGYLINDALNIQTKYQREQAKTPWNIVGDDQLSFFFGSHTQVNEIIVCCTCL